ncbi:MAG: hypothetical protein NC311_10050 [Muribaculaceae bacterium]|nr:hypothetical protein [Muribaculaceae bacterium]
MADNYYLVTHPARSRDAGVVIYWRPRRDGYTALIHEAGVYTYDQAQAIQSSASPEHARLKPLTPELLAAMGQSLDAYKDAATARFQAAQDDYRSDLERCRKARGRISKIHDAMKE